MGLQMFGKNIIRLFKFDLKTHHKAVREFEKFPMMLDNLKYEIADEIRSLKLPKVMTQFESVQAILDTNKSVARFGDGEFNLILGNAIGFQEYDEELSRRLKEILMTKDEGMLIGISRRFGTLDDVDEQVRAYWRCFMIQHRAAIYEMLDFDKTYIDTCMTAHSIEVDDHTTPECRADTEKYYNLVRQIWEGKEITVIKGEDTEKFTYDIYDNAKSVSYIYGPKEHAWREYKRILAEAEKLPKDRLIIAVLGPTAKVLAYDLHKQGYRVLDIGHMGKAYNWLKTHNDKIVAGQFFAA